MGSSSILALMRTVQRMKADVQAMHLDAECPSGCIRVDMTDFTEDDRVFLRSLATIDVKGQYIVNTRVLSDAQLAELKQWALKLGGKAA